MALSLTQAANTPTVVSTTDISSPKTAGEAARSALALKLIKQGLMPGTPEFAQAYQDGLTGKVEEGGGKYHQFGNIGGDYKLAETLLAGNMSNNTNILKAFIAASK